MILFNWKLRIAYVLLGAGLGVSLALSDELPLVPTVGVFVCLSALRIIWEARRSS
jgi:hypothetical protein